MNQDITQLLNTEEKDVKALFLSTYVPSKCGIATFARDLSNALNLINPENPSRIIALNSNGYQKKYPKEVIKIIKRSNPEEYKTLGGYINRTSSNIISLQHEFGLYGGIAGSNIFETLEKIDKPIITTMHTILSHPDIDYFWATQKILDLSTAIVVMLPEAKKILCSLYKINPQKINVIHHGVTSQPEAKTVNKIKTGLEYKKLMLISGLINPSKGIEYVIEAMPEILKEAPDTHLVVLGQTHPEIIKTVGEVYRDSLIELAKNLNVTQNVHFINKYVSLIELLTYFEACDIYLTPHLDPEQITSGTLAYALGMGKACISTKYTYANSMLKDGGGILVDFKNSSQIAQNAIAILNNPGYKLQIEKKAYLKGRNMTWSKVAEKYFNLFRKVLYENGS